MMETLGVSLTTVATTLAIATRDRPTRISRQRSTASRMRSRNGTLLAQSPEHYEVLPCGKRCLDPVDNECDRSIVLVEQAVPQALASGGELLELHRAAPDRNQRHHDSQEKIAVRKLPV